MLKNIMKNKYVYSALIIIAICLAVQIILSLLFKKEGFDNYESDLKPSQFPSELLLEDTFKVNPKKTGKNMPGDYLDIKRNVNTKQIKNPDNGLCSPMDVCGIYLDK
jgi:hypothetical protein